MRQWGWVEKDGSITFTSSSMPPSIDAEQSLAISGSDFDRHCDAIDSIHANLERENASLKAELDRLMGERDRDGWVELPKDADGEYIHIGDVMEWPEDGETFEVVGIGDGWTLFYVIEDGVAEWTRAESKRHHQPDTWERIIEDATALGAQMGRRTTQVDDLVARCRALAGDAS